MERREFPEGTPTTRGRSQGPLFTGRGGHSARKRFSTWPSSAISLATLFASGRAPRAAELSRTGHSSKGGAVGGWCGGWG